LVNVMSLNSSPLAAAQPRIVVAPKAKKRRGWWLVIPLVALIGVFSAHWAWSEGMLPQRFWKKASQNLETVTIARGDLSLFVIESGSLESANNTTVKCKVEALIGLVGGTQGATSGSRGGSRGNAGAGGAGGASGGQGGSNPAQASPKAASKGGGGAAGKGKTAGGTSKTGSAGAAGGAAGSTGGASAGGASAGGAGGGAGGGAAGATGASGGSAATKAPTLRSFTYAVTPYVPLRPQTAPQPKAKTQQGGMQKGGGGRGGDGGRGGGGQGGPGGGQGRAGSTSILSIVPEGTVVKEGDIVCVLDSSAFRDELQAEVIKYLQAEAWLKQARDILEVNDISLREYRDGIYVQDLSLIKQYVTMCKIEQDRATRNLAWSEATYKKKYRAASQLQADVLWKQQADIALSQALGMQERLVKFTAPRLIKGLTAKLEANKADLSAQEAAFQLETARKKTLETIIENCTVRAPRDGLVVYANTSSMWGMVRTQIEEGATLYEGQPIFNLPDPNHMCVKAKINETKVSFLHEGQKASIRIDAFPDRPLRGTVAEITAMPAPSNGPTSDIRVYYATVDLDTRGFEALRPGLSAEVSFFVDSRDDVVRIPIRAIRWHDDTPYAAIMMPDGPQWRSLKLGLMNYVYAEVLSGLEPGDKVVAAPSKLPEPRGIPVPIPLAAPAVADARL
jgi:HlyD family secretion protein